MEIRIIRGQNQIGGSVIEISATGSSIILDAGLNLDENRYTEIPEVPGLFKGKAGYDAIIISHYHADHIGLLSNVVAGIPIYMGEKSFTVHAAASGYRKKPLNFQPLFMKDSMSFQVGAFTITPFLCDHSAFDSYMILVEAEGKKVLYTGDYRSNGRKSFAGFLRKLPEVDALIIEGTVLSRDTFARNITEYQLESQADKFMKNCMGPVFVMQSATNIDRIVTMYRSAVKAHRIFLEDLYMSEITSAVGGSIPNPITFNNVRVFMVQGGDENYKKLTGFGAKRIGRKGIRDEKFVMCVRSSMKNYLDKLSKEMSFDGGILFYSMWKGYKENADTKSFLNFMKDKGVSIHTLHTSGHADVETIELLIKKTSPKILIPVHTENAEWFERYRPDIQVERQCDHLNV